MITPELFAELERIRDGLETRPVHCQSVLKKGEAAAENGEELQLVAEAKMKFLEVSPVRHSGDD